MAARSKAGSTWCVSMCHACRWAPQWIQVELLAYTGARPLFSILWSYPRSGFRELMDFSPLPYANGSSLAELGS